MSKVKYHLPLIQGCWPSWLLRISYTGKTTPTGTGEVARNPKQNAYAVALLEGEDKPAVGGMQA